MGRRMRPLDPGIGPVELFASELRALRAFTGELPFWKMARRCDVSKSALAAAVAGRVLPSEKVTREFVRVCGGDWDRWRERWLLAVAELAEDRAPSAGTGGVLAIPQEKGVRLVHFDTDMAARPSSAGGTVATRVGRAARRPGRGWRSLVVPIALVALAGAGIGYFSLKSSSPAQDARKPTVTARAVATVRVISDDTDPKDVGCDRGVVDTIATANVFGPDRLFLGYVWLRYAPACQAVWARFEPATDDMANLPGATVSIEAVRPSDGRTLSYSTPYLGAFVYGNMLLITHGCVWAEATVTAPHPTQGPTTALPAGPITAYAATSCALPPAK